MPTINSKFEIKASNHKEYHAYYMSKHSEPWCRRLHLLGTAVGVGGVVAGLARQDPALAGSSAAAGFGLAMVGDVAVQRITPTVVKNPIYSFMSNFKMCYEMVKNGKF